VTFFRFGFRLGFYDKDKNKFQFLFSGLILSFPVDTGFIQFLYDLYMIQQKTKKNTNQSDQMAIDIEK